MKKIREKDVQGLELFCILTALAAVMLGIMFWFDFWQNRWLLNVILILGILLHVALTMLLVLQQKSLNAFCALLMTVIYSGVLMYFNL